MKSIIVFIVINIMVCYSGISQNLSGVWSGVITQPGNAYSPCSMDVRVNQVGKFLSGEIKTNCRNGFVVQKFRGLIYDGKVLMNEFEVVEDSSDISGWCLKDLKGFFFVELKENKRVIEGPWTSQKNYQQGAYLAGRNCPPGTFKISQRISSTIKNSRTSVVVHQDPNVQNINPARSAAKIGETPDRQGFRTADNIRSLADVMPNKNMTSKDSADNRATPFSKPKLGQKLTLSVRFEQSKAVILPESMPELDMLLAYLKTYPSLEIVLLGHTDNQGDPARNITLSFDRVNIIKKYLVAHSISTNRISVKGLGSNTPVAGNNTEENRRLNRRVEMVVTKE